MLAGLKCSLMGGYDRGSEDFLAWFKPWVPLKSNCLNHADFLVLSQGYFGGRQLAFLRHEECTIPDRASVLGT